MSEVLLTVTILGSGTSSGVPMLGCGCDVCTSRDIKNVRTRCSALLSWGGKNILVDTSTDFRSQGLRENLHRIDAVLYTHTHADHLHGIDDLRAFNRPGEGPIPVYGSKRTVGAIKRNFSYIFSDDEGYRPRLETYEIDGPFDLFGVRVEPIPLMHGQGRSLGFRVGDFAYLTDCSAIPDESLPLLEGLDTLVIDGLRFRPHETHFSISQAIGAASQMGALRTYLTHLSHDVDYEKCSNMLPEGVSLAYDGLKIALTLKGPNGPL